MTAETLARPCVSLQRRLDDSAWLRGSHQHRLIARRGCRWHQIETGTTVLCGWPDSTPIGPSVRAAGGVYLHE